MGQTQKQKQPSAVIPPHAASKAAPQSNGADEQWDTESRSFEIDGWWSPEFGAIQGKVIAVLKLRDKRPPRGIRLAYVLELVKPCKARGRDQERGEEPDDFEPGDVIGVRERYEIGKEIRGPVEAKRDVEVLIVPDKKVPIGDNDMWRFETIRTRGGTPRTTPLRVPDPPSAEGGDETDDIPF